MLGQTIASPQDRGCPIRAVRSVQGSSRPRLLYSRASNTRNQSWAVSLLQAGRTREKLGLSTPFPFLSARLSFHAFCVRPPPGSHTTYTCSCMKRSFAAATTTALILLICIYAMGALAACAAARSRSARGAPCSGRAERRSRPAHRAARTRKPRAIFSLSVSSLHVFTLFLVMAASTCSN